MNTGPQTYRTLLLPAVLILLAAGTALVQAAENQTGLSPLVWVATRQAGLER